MEVKTIKAICEEYGLGQTDLARRFGIPLRTVQNWHSGRRPTPDYVARMIDELLRYERNTRPLPVAAVDLEKLGISKEQAEKIFFSLED